MKSIYTTTVRACSFGYIVQAVVNNFLPLLFVYFTVTYNIPFFLIAIITTYNFVLQILVDSLSAKIVLKIGYRKTAILSCVVSFLGLTVVSVTPYIFSNYIFIYIGIMLAVTLMAMGSGILEVILSPLIEAIPEDGKSSRMSLLHSFYSIGHVSVCVLSTAFFFFIGIDKWQILAFVFALIPIINIIMFSKCKIVTPKGDDKPVKALKLFRNGGFILLFLLMISAGASEQAIAQWISFFAESTLQVEKTLGDVIGTSAFAFCMFVSRFYLGVSKKKRDTKKVLFASSVLLSVCYILSSVSSLKILSLVSLALGGIFVATLWPGVYSVAGEIFVSGGTVMFSMLALGGDVGCTLGPTFVGLITEISSMKLAMFLSACFPVLSAVCVIILSNKNKQGKILPLENNL